MDLQQFDQPDYYVHPAMLRGLVVVLLAVSGGVVAWYVRASRAVADFFSPAPHKGVEAAFTPTPSAQLLLGDLRASEASKNPLLQSAGRALPESVPRLSDSYAFISYSHKDKEYVARLTNHLKRNSVPFWIDSMIPLGATWNREIGQRIKSASAYILVMTPNAEASDRVQAELAHALNQKLDPFPLLLEGDDIFGINHAQHASVQGGRMPDASFVEGVRSAISRRRPSP